MVLPTAFGWSAGDLVTTIRIVVKTAAAFKETGGASSKYAAQEAFLRSLKSTLQHLEKHVNDSTQSDYSKDISSLLERISEPWADFKKFLDIYENALGQNSTKSKLGKAPKTIAYTLKDLSGKVEKLQREIDQPLQAINSLLSLHMIRSIEELPKRKLTISQCAQLVDAINLANIPAELEKQIQELKKAADKHDSKQDLQLQAVERISIKLEESNAKLHSALNDLIGQSRDYATAGNHHKEQMASSRNAIDGLDELSAALEEQTNAVNIMANEHQDLILALRQFVEEKVSKLQIILEMTASNTHAAGIDAPPPSSSWPSATLPTAQLAAILISSVVSSLAAGAVVKMSVSSEVRLVIDERQATAIPLSALSTTDTIKNTPLPSPQSSTSKRDRTTSIRKWITEFGTFKTKRMNQSISEENSSLKKVDSRQATENKKASPNRSNTAMRSQKKLGEFAIPSAAGNDLSEWFSTPVGHDPRMSKLSTSDGRDENDGQHDTDGWVNVPGDNGDLNRVIISPQPPSIDVSNIRSIDTMDTSNNGDSSAGQFWGMGGWDMADWAPWAIGGSGMGGPGRESYWNCCQCHKPQYSKLDDCPLLCFYCYHIVGASGHIAWFAAGAS